jgi:CRISPR-associated protein (TIGR03986 family)
MQTGTVVRLEKGYGFIQPDGGGRQVFFHHSSFRGQIESLEGACVEFEAEEGEKGPRATTVRRVGSVARADPAPAPHAARAGTPAGDRFLNPYNFVRPAPEPKASLPASDIDAALLGRCAPPPFDRYVGLTGRATCRITTVDPVFVTDPYEVQGEKGEHQSFRFFRDGDGTPAIPASTLRGVVRSVFEAVTNSCWELVSPRTLSRRVQTNVAALLVPGRVVREGEKWFFEELSGDTGYCPRGPVKDGLELYAAWVARYDREGNHLPPRPSRAPELDDDEAQEYGERGFPVIPTGLRHGAELCARLRPTHHPSASGKNEFYFWNVEALGATEADVQQGRQSADLIVRGYYCETGFNINRKHDERFFFTTASTPHREAIDVKFVERYVALLKDYRELHSREAGTEREDRTRPSRFVESGDVREVAKCHGELMYAWLEDKAPHAVHALAPVSVPRLFYDHSIRDRFPGNPAVEPCSDLKQDGPAPRLCPACRVFGWVHNPRGQERSAEEKAPAVPASRSRVRFGAARFAGEDLDDAQKRQLDILSSPKPTTVRFYLMPASGAMESVRPGGKVVNEEVAYDQPHMVVRGRKFYRSHRDVRLHPPEKPSGQNRTVREWLKPGRSAEFNVGFESLAPVELGALLWSLEQEPGFVHRLGFGKPLGLGTVKIEVTGLTLHGTDRYATEASASAREEADPLAYVEPLKQVFRRAMTRRYGTAFAELPNVADLRALLNANPPDLRVHYPSLDSADAPEGGQSKHKESFHWFVVNNGRKYPDRAAAGRGVWLPIAAEDEGLPYDPALPLNDR